MSSVNVSQSTVVGIFEEVSQASTASSSTPGGPKCVVACLESRNSFAYAAVCHRLLALDPGCPRLLATVTGSRDPNFCVTLLCDNIQKRTVCWTVGRFISYWVEHSPDPVATDGKPEVFRRLMLEEAGQIPIRRFVEDAVKRYQSRCSDAVPDTINGGVPIVPTYTWDGEAWCRSGFREPRDMNTLFLPYGLAEDIADDLRAFFEQAAELRRLHVSPVRTYMLHGTPGSGKSSLVHCLASVMSCGIATMTFVPGTTDADVVNSIVRLPPRCLLVIEDVDCAFSGRAAKNHGATFGAVLSALDGVHSRAPLAVFLTTNRMPELDPALLRRVDMVSEFKTATYDQISRMYTAFFPHASHDWDQELKEVWDAARGRASMSTIQKYCVKVRQASRVMTLDKKLDLLRSLIQCVDQSGGGGGDTGHLYG
jgi:energy-coupling factor transporter ATP-binding protein EcfA2